eukprot:518149_1
MNEFQDLLYILQRKFIKYNSVFNFLILNSKIKNTQVKLVQYNNSLYCFGYGNSGRLGLEEYNGMESCTTPTISDTLSDENINKVAAYHSHCLCLTMSDKIYGWGDNKEG